MNGRSARRRWMLRLLLVAGTLLGLSGFRALPAAAHAELVSTVPAADANLGQAPSEVRLRFTEQVSVTAGSIRVFDASGERVDQGGAERVEGDDHVVRIALPDLPDGGYVVAWRVVSADSHPIRGAFDFRVGTGGRAADAELVADVLGSNGGDRAVGVTFATARVLTFAALALLIGGGAFLGWVWPPGRRSAAARRLWFAGWAGTAVGTFAQVGLEGLYGAGLPLGDIATWSVWEDVLATRYGLWSSTRLGALAVAALVAVSAGAAGSLRRPGPLVLGLGAVFAVAVAGTVALAGHASSGRWVPGAVVADVVHVVAASAWLGGLALAVLVMLRAPAMAGAPGAAPGGVEPPGAPPQPVGAGGAAGGAADVAPGPVADPTGAAGAMGRFSALATGAVIAIVASGAFQAWRQVGEIDALDTSYGRILIVKLVGVATVVAVALAARRMVHRPSVTGPPPGSPGWARRLRGTVAAEAVAGVAILVVTSLLVNTPPARGAVARPFTAQLSAEELVVDLSVDPARNGPADIHVYVLSATGGVHDVPEVRIDLTLPAADLGPLPVPLEEAGAGHYAAYGYDVPLAGTWTVEVAVRVDDFREVVATTSMVVR